MMRPVRAWPVLAMFVIVALAAQAQARNTPIGRAFKIEDTSDVAEISFVLSRAAELEPALYRRILADAKRTLVTFKKQAAADLKEFGKENWRTHIYDVAYEDRFVSGRMISMLITTGTYTGGAHPNFTFSSLLWDRQAQEQVALGDLLTGIKDKSPALKAIADYVRSDLTRQKMERAGLTAAQARNDWGLQEVKPLADLYQTFTLTLSTAHDMAAGLTFHFPPYQFGAYVEGSYRVDVPAGVFAKYLKPEYVGLFGGARQDLDVLHNWRAPGAVVVIEKPKLDSTVASPLVMSGEAPVFWFFEGSMPIEIRDGQENLIASGYVSIDRKAQTSNAGADMARFLGKVEFTVPNGVTAGEIRILQNDPSEGEGGKPGWVTLPVRFQK